MLVAEKTPDDKGEGVLIIEDNPEKAEELMKLIQVLVMYFYFILFLFISFSFYIKYMLPLLLALHPKNRIRCRSSPQIFDQQ